MNPRSRSSTGHPIQVAARRSGLSPDVIRAWERRYEAVEPVRSRTNRRLYTDEDVERLFLLGQVTRVGRRIGDVASLSTEELRAMVAEDRNAEARIEERIPEPEAPGSRHHMEACLDALQHFDADALESALREASIDLPLPAMLQQLLMPFLRKVGEHWRSGEIHVAHEHMATSIVRSFLGAVKHNRSLPDTAPELVVATPSGQRHELGALMVAVVAAADGWRVTYLGADLPGQEIAAAAVGRRARAVALSVVYPPDDAHLAEDLRALRAGLGRETLLVAGGASAEAYRDVLAEVGAYRVSEIAGLRAKLEEMRYGAAGAD